MRTTGTVLLAMALLVAALATSRAQGEPDHERARRALEAGEIVSLSTVLAAVEKEFNGQVVEVELERESGRWVYEIEILTSEANVIELTYDARSVTLIAWEGRGVEAARKGK